MDFGHATRSPPCALDPKKKRDRINLSLWDLVASQCLFQGFLFILNRKRARMRTLSVIFRTIKQAFEIDPKRLYGV